jgi:hypothetical protein
MNRKDVPIAEKHENSRETAILTEAAKSKESASSLFLS